jgi:hypothetical protein
MSKFIAYLNEQDGFSAAEYALGFAAVGVVAGLAATTLSGFLGNSANFINDVAGCVRTHSYVTTC